tara:strand:+ start:32167 stop:33417 length:1251 start_codon:yes stop_codon:yes gene_type:complete
MNKKNLNIHIIGGGISGLVAARVLENHGFSPQLIEATERVGGRVKTDVIDGYQLDQGFQVLLTAYPAVQNYLDYKALDLQKFLPGAAIFSANTQKLIGDPLRTPSLVFSTLFSGIGSLSDKFKILKLNFILKKKTLSDIFAEPEQTTLSYLRDFGFSKAIIEDFFSPFFSGIFLETQLETSSRMFEFVYKMFGAGHATVPKAGMEAIPKQLLSQLKTTSFHYNTKVSAVKDGEISLENGRVLESDFTILTSPATELVSNLKNQSTAWKSCVTLYFETHSRVIHKPLIGLIARPNTLVNNIVYSSSLKTESTPAYELLCITVIDDQSLSDEDLATAVEAELKTYCQISTRRLIKQYRISKALPKLTNLKYEMMPSETQLTNRIYIAGDTQLNASLNAAMIAGERAALAVVEAATKTL